MDFFLIRVFQFYLLWISSSYESFNFISFGSLPHTSLSILFPLDLILTGNLFLIRVFQFYFLWISSSLVISSSCESSNSIFFGSLPHTSLSNLFPLDLILTGNLFLIRVFQFYFLWISSSLVIYSSCESSNSISLDLFLIRVFQFYFFWISSSYESPNFISFGSLPHTCLSILFPLDLFLIRVFQFYFLGSLPRTSLSLLFPLNL